MVLTPEQSQAALQHLIGTVLVTVPTAQGQPNRLQEALTQAGVEGIENFLSMDKSMIDGLTYEEQGQRVPLHLARRKVIEIFFDFVTWRASEGNPVGDNWANLTRDEFATFRTSADCLQARATAGAFGSP